MHVSVLREHIGVWRERISADQATIKAISDATLFFAALLFVELSLAKGSSLADIDPHPFWIPVILVTAKHGSRSGLATAAIATFLALAFLRPERVPTDDLYAYSLKLLFEPVLWLAASLVLGQIRDRDIRHEAELGSALDVAMRQRENIARHCNELRQRIAGLERQIACSDSASVAAGFETLARIGNASGEHVWQAVEKAGEQLLGACRLTVVYNDGNASFRRILTCGSAPAEASNRTKFKDLIAGAVFRHEIKAKTRHRAIGFVCADQLPEKALTPWAERAFRAICLEIGRALEREHLQRAARETVQFRDADAA